MGREGITSSAVTAVRCLDASISGASSTFWQRPDCWRRGPTRGLGAQSRNPLETGGMHGVERILLSAYLKRACGRARDPPPSNVPYYPTTVKDGGTRTKSSSSRRAAARACQDKAAPEGKVLFFGLKGKRRHGRLGIWSAAGPSVPSGHWFLSWSKPMKQVTNPQH